MISDIGSVEFIYSLKSIKGLGDKSVIAIIDKYPSHESLMNIAPQELSYNLGRKVSELVQLGYIERWPIAHEETNARLAEIRNRGVKALAYKSDGYPPLLKAIKDPPPIIYALGDEKLLKSKKCLAIVGTREPTNLGRRTSFKVASKFSQEGFSIVSGLAKGIDTEAHKGALSVDGVTIAVLGTSLDKVYPAENRDLAKRIELQSGLIISEIEPGQGSNRSAFVRRNRIQSGISIGIIAIQSDISGGTMHTVSFAVEQGRLVFVPKPNAEEEHHKQYQGIWELVKSKGAKIFLEDEFEDVVSALKAHSTSLLANENPSSTDANSNDGDYTQLSLRIPD